MKRVTLLWVAALTVVVGCGEETFQAPPDCGGRFLVVYARQLTVDQADVYLYDFGGLGFHLLPNLNSVSQPDLDPALSSDVRLIAFERVLSPTNTDILIYDRCAAGILPQPGLNTILHERDPAFSHDRQRLAFVRDTLGRREVRLYDGASSRLVPLPGIEGTGLYQDSWPALDQDGGLIAFVSDRGGSPDVLVYDASGDSLLDLPDLASPDNDVDPTLTPDGRYLMFASDRPGGAGDYDLYLYDLQNRSFLVLDPEASSPETDRGPTINASSDRIVFESNRAGTQGAMDLWLYTRSEHAVVRAGASSASTDMQPWIVWQ